MHSAQPPCAAALSAWREAYCGPAVQSELGAFAQGQPLLELPQLAGLFSPNASAAIELAHGLVAALVGDLRGEPDQSVPLRHFLNDQLAMLILLRSGTALLSLQVFQRCLTDLPSAAVFSPVEVYEHVLAGSGRAVRLDRMQVGGTTVIGQTPLDLCGGVITVCTSSQQTQLITRVDHALLALRLQRALPGCEPARLIDLQSGCVVQQAAGNLADTRLELAAAVLGQMERCDAALGLADAALGTRSPAARWQAVRAALALDSRAGFKALSTMAARRDDPLAEPAQALCEQLSATWPQLGELATCR